MKNPQARVALSSAVLFLLVAGLCAPIAGCSAPPSRDAGSWHQEGLAFVTQGQHQEALYCFDKATKIDPLFVPAWKDKASVALTMGKLKEAADYFSRVVELDPQDAIAWRERGIALVALGQPDPAISCFDRALKIDPRDPIAWTEKGRACLNLMSSPEAALPCFEKACELAPRDVRNWTNRFSALLILRFFSEAQQCLDDARKAGVTLDAALTEELRKGIAEYEREQERYRKVRRPR
jgi:tetratricopeptide (TPR) repeat protein